MRKTGQMKKAAAILLAGAMAVSMMAGCGKKTEDNTTKAAETIETSEAAETAEQQTADQNKISFTDAAGREITLEKPAEKIVSGYYITTSMLIALGVEDRVVGIEAKADKRPIYKLAAPEFLELPNVGTAKEFNLEGCAALKPDLVILPKKLAEQADILKDLGITAMVVNPESEAELKETIENIATATGTADRAREIFTYYDEQTARLEEIVKKNETAGKARPVIYMAGTSGVLRTAGASMYQNNLIELAGGRNAAADLTDKGWTDISYEALLSYNPDMIVIIPEAEYTKEDVLSDAQLKDLQAVKNGAVYEMPSDIEAWDSPVTSGILGSLWLTSVVDPDSYPAEAFNEDVKDFYKSFYDIEIETK